MNKQVSASNVEAFVRCTASHILPQHDSYQEKTEKGTAGHALLGALINRTHGAATKLEAELPGLSGALADAMHGVEAATAEEAYVVDVQKRTSTYVGRNINREYAKALGRPLTKYEIGTSLDVWGTKGDVVWIRDFKFGIYSSWWQLYVQAMAILWLPTSLMSEADAGFLHIEDPHDNEDVEIREDAATLYLVDLDDRAEELMTAFGRADSLERMLAAGVHYSDLKVIEGKWCQYCGAFPHCPAKWKLARNMLALDVVGHLPSLTAEQAGEAWLKLSEIKKNIIKKMEDALKERMRAEGGLPLLDGKMLRVMPMPGRVSLDKEATIDLLRAKGATPDEIARLYTRGESYDQVRKVNR